MTWTYGEIEREWGAASSTPALVVEAFERVERVLGREWMDATRIRSGMKTQGAAPFLHVFSMGGRLRSLDGVAGTEPLVRRIGRQDESAESELTAMHLLRSRYRAAEIELEPDVSSGRTIRQADFRIRVPGSPWTYVEVTNPNVSELRERLAAILGKVRELVYRIKRGFALEVRFMREPSDEEVEHLVEHLPSFCADDQFRQEEFQDFALLSLSDVKPGLVVVNQDTQKTDQSWLAEFGFIGGGNEPPRHIVVRMPHADDRAEEFLSNEAKQLPKSHGALIMVDAGGEPSAFQSWEPLIARRFQPAIHTRVSGLCLFSPDLLPTTDGLLWVLQVQLHLNRHATIPLDQWIQDALADAAEDFRTCLAASTRDSG